MRGKGLLQDLRMELTPPLEEYVDSGLFTITLLRGDTGNLLNPAALSALRDSLQQALSDSSIRAIFIRSSTDTFCMGMDLPALARADGETAALQEAISVYSGILSTIYQCEKPVIALVTGEAHAGGMGLACACDIVCATPDASFCLSEVLFGLVPANVMPYLLGYRLSPQKARYLSLSTRKLSGEEAYRLGIVDELAHRKDMERLLKNRIRQLLRSSPKALAATKDLTAKMAGKDYEFKTKTAAEALLEIASDPGVLEAIRAFQEGMTPVWFTTYKPSQKLFPGEEL